MTTALVTGASAGIGKAICTQLAGQGHNLVLVSRTRADLEAVANELRSRCRVTVEVLPADLATRRGRDAVCERLRATEQPVEILVNNAGFGYVTPFLDTPVEDEQRLLDVLCGAVMVLSHAAGQQMKERGRGAIVNVSSIAGLLPTGGTYGAAKAWVSVFSEGLAAELRPHGVTVTAVHPGLTHTEFHERAHMEDYNALPEPMWLSPDQAAYEGLKAARHGAVWTTPSFKYRVMMGVMSLVPRPILRWVNSVASRH